MQTTSDAGRHWHTVAANGLPTQKCSVMSVTVANSNVAWVVARSGSRNGTALFQTRDDGRTWQRVRLLRG